MQNAKIASELLKLARDLSARELSVKDVKKYDEAFLNISRDLDSLIKGLKSIKPELASDIMKIRNTFNSSASKWDDEVRQFNKQN